MKVAYENINQLIQVEAVDGEFNINGLSMTGVNFQTVGSNTDITIVAIEALEDTF